MDRYAVMGNPIAHSLSPRIHAMFAAQTGQDLEYEAILVPRDEFAQALKRFVQEGGKGLNITLPFKGQAWSLVRTRSERATQAKAVNTIVVNEDGSTYGDNTDGAGLLRDLTINLGLELAGKRILILGAGGAVRGVMQPLLEARPTELVIANRTVERAENLRDEFAALGPLEACGFANLAGRQFDLIINGTSAGVTGQVPDLPEDLVEPTTACYDMFYSNQPTAFVRWSLDNGAAQAVDGLGMLVEQAAESFWLWRELRPVTRPVIEALRPTV